MSVVEEPPIEGHTTKRWAILDRHGSVLGEVKWFGRWRQYAFAPLNSSIFNIGCMRDIAGFIEERMKEWRARKK